MKQTTQIKKGNDSPLKQVPLGQVCDDKNCSWYELGYSKKCHKHTHSYKPNGDLEAEN